jgi:uroporphyrinogen-III synthase
VSLKGLTVAITASRRASELALIIENFHGKPYVAPTIGIEANLESPNEDVTEFINIITKQNVDYVVFMTGPGIFSLMSIAKRLGLEEKLIHSLSKVTIFARSLKPATALKKYGIKVSMIPEENTARGVSKLLLTRGVVGKRIAILWHGDSPQQLREELYNAGAESVIEASTYKYSLELKKEGASILNSMGFNYIAPSKEKVISLIDNIFAGNIDAITFTSPPSVHDLFKIAHDYNVAEKLRNSLNTNVVIVAIGPSTKHALEENDIFVDVMPHIFKMGPMIKALDDYISQNSSNILKIKKKMTEKETEATS